MIWGFISAGLWGATICLYYDRLPESRCQACSRSCRPRIVRHNDVMLLRRSSARLGDGTPFAGAIDSDQCVASTQTCVCGGFCSQILEFGVPACVAKIHAGYITTKLRFLILAPRPLPLPLALYWMATHIARNTARIFRAFSDIFGCRIGCGRKGYASRLRLEPAQPLNACFVCVVFLL